MENIKVDLKPLFSSVREAYNSIDPYSKSGSFLLELYQVNKDSYKTLFGMEKLARFVVYEGRLDFKSIVEEVNEPLRSFLLGQVMLIEGEEKGLKLIKDSLRGLEGEDKQEAMVILYLYDKDVKGLEQMLNLLEKSKRLNGYLSLVYLELGDYYYKNKDYRKAKEYYKNYLEREEEDDVYWLTAYKLAKLSSMLGDTQTLNLVVKKAEKANNIVSRVIVALWR